MTIDLAIPHLLAALLAGGAIVLGLAVGLILLLRKARFQLARALLGGFLVAGALSLSNELVATLELPRLSEHFWVMPLVYTFSLGPLVFLFVRQRLHPGKSLVFGDLKHAILPLVQILHELISGFGTLALKRAYWHSGFLTIYGNIESLVFVASFGGYLLAAWRLISSEAGSPSIEHNAVQLADGLATWLRRLVIGCAAIVFVALVMQTPFVAPMLRGQFGQESYRWLRLVEMTAYSALMYWVAFTGFVHTLPPREPPAQRTSRSETYGLTEQDVQSHSSRLRQLVEVERAFLDSSLTLGELADRVGLSENELSYVLNEGLEMSYTDYINGLRVAEA